MRPTIEPLDGPIGARVAGSLEVPVPAATARRLRTVLDEHLLLVWRDQRITPSQLAEITRAFADVELPWDITHRHPDDERVQVITNANRQGVTYKTQTLYWHTDRSFMPQPSAVLALYAVAVPPQGGNTCFANMRSAYQALPAAIQRLLDGARARHSFAFRMAGLTGKRQNREYAAKLAAQFPPVVHPLVRRHPRTAARSLFINELCVDRILELDDAESDKLLAVLYAHCTRPEFLYTHHWSVGDLLIWDNGSLLHRAEDIPVGTPRILHRCLAGGRSRPERRRGGSSERTS